jgi:hypothetical protein
MSKITVAIILSFILSLECAILADASGRVVFTEFVGAQPDWTRPPATAVNLQKKVATTWGYVRCDMLKE